MTRLVPGEALFDVVDSLDRDDVGRQLAHFLAELHHPATRKRVEAVLGDLPPAALQPATTEVLRDQIVRWARPDQSPAVVRWCDWADDVLATPGPSVLAHADLHDALWRSEAGVPLPDHRTAPDWVDDLAERFGVLGIG